MNEIKRLTDKEVKTLLSKDLKSFADFCDLNGLRYFLGGGTLLGAIRHQGFIPWDDDVDVLMPRPDYDAFLKLTALNPIRENLIVQAPDRNDDYLWPFAKIINTDTVLIELQYMKKYRDLQRQWGGLYIDVFPIDGVPDSKKEQKDLFKKIKFYTKGLQRSTYRIDGVRPLIRYLFRLSILPVYRIIGFKWFLKN
jgi:lipopolysaccharide cholinephosphotransferase